MKSISTVFSFIILALLAGCTNTQPMDEPELHITAPAITQETNATDSDAYPAPSIDSAYPGSGQSVEFVADEHVILGTGFEPNEPVPTPSLDRTTATGYVVFKETGSPLINVPVLLAQIYRNEEGDGAFVYDTSSSPYALTDDNGRFIFTDVEPTEFILVIGNIEVNRYELLTEPDGSSRILSLPLGEILDLDVVEVELEW